MPVSQQVPVLDFDPFADDFLTDPLPFHERLREAGPAVRLEVYDIWAMARCERSSRRSVTMTHTARRRAWG